MENFSYKGKCGYVDVRVSSHLKEELAWAADKQLWVISTIDDIKKFAIVKNGIGIKGQKSTQTN